MMVEILNAIATWSDCYKERRSITPAGIVVHSTGANNPNLKRYVNSPDILGENIYKNYWGTGSRQAKDGIPHAAVGLDKNGKVKIAQVLPFNIRCWSAGSGSRGSYNNSHIQFEICEDGLTDKTYFEKAFDVAAQFCAYLIQQFPKITLDSVVSHKEAHALGFASNHGDPENWLSKFSHDMNWFRNNVKTYLNHADNDSGNIKVYRVQKCEQLAAFSSFQYAKNYADNLKADGIDVIITSDT